MLQTHNWASLVPAKRIKINFKIKFKKFKGEIRTRDIY